MAKEEIQASNLEDLVFQLNEAEHKTILIVEATYLVLLALLADVIEFFLPAIGPFITVPTIYVIIFLWSFFRRIHGRFIIRQIIGKVIDALLLGVWPIGTIAMLITVWLNNRAEKKTIKEILDILERYAKLI